ncbi:hypothetical protein DFW101_1385 [Solidesulfovibrio carbinoliphilus subsp. oakridgensis]|uniref:YkgJ family cysteine cluster protein n=1 Tax=Solidesulfovibrio carbinoliphilus subsp. oakridgensis TaxID=694327 RepID=G7Q7T5_9BACT|nr:hypothetical protein [Solidesulfovibrio carbinoliphilus]EHJ47394.1 hypothetical protein DFW101_1385 [Solidesulfovibrio carbinoliphilus subsp. oakridgensis]
MTLSFPASRLRATLKKLAALYADMDKAYTAAASAAGLDCAGCAENCCLSFFQHHTLVEWLYLQKGLAALPEDRRTGYERRAREYVDAAREAASRGETPRLMCPVNDDGLCGLYEHRLMICRLHGVPNVLLGSMGVREFPGCGPCQRLADGRELKAMDRTPLLRRLAGLEMELWGSKPGRPPKVDLTLAEMIVAGPPGK